MSAEDFLDSNVLVYLFDQVEPAKRERAEQLVSQCLSNGSGCISYQVVQETLNVLVRRLGVSHADVSQFMDDVLIPLWQVYPSPSLYRTTLSIHSRYGFSFYDSLIVAAALETGCTRLYTEDLQDEQRIGPLTVVNPFRN